MNTIGHYLAHLAIEGAKNGKKVTRPMCGGCAFKHGTPANGEKKTCQDAFDALLSPNLKFVCHENTNVACTGYVLADSVE